MFYFALLRVNITYYYALLQTLLLITHYYELLRRTCTVYYASKNPLDREINVWPLLTTDSASTPIDEQPDVPWPIIGDLRQWVRGSSLNHFSDTQPLITPKNGSRHTTSKAKVTKSTAEERAYSVLAKGPTDVRPPPSCNRRRAPISARSELGKQSGSAPDASCRPRR